MRRKNVNRVIIGNININSLPNKFDQVKEFILKFIDILIITETKLDDSFPTSQFHVEGFSTPLRLDRSRYGGGEMIYVRDYITNRILDKHCSPSDIENIFVELNFRKLKWLLCGTYHPPSQPDDYYFHNLDMAIDTYSQYEKVLIVGDFNSEVSEKSMASFLLQRDFKSIVKTNTCFKSVSNPSCIDLFVTNSPLNFQHTSTYSTGLSDFHKLVLTVMKTTIPKNKPREIIYRDYKKFDCSKFNQELENKFVNKDIASLKDFTEEFLDVLNKNAPTKNKLIRANHAPYITKKK